MDNRWIVSVDLVVFTLYDALKDESFRAHFDHATRGPHKAILVVILDPVHLV